MDIVRRRCTNYPQFGNPGSIGMTTTTLCCVHVCVHAAFVLAETVDKFQGQQADYVLLSLVRTRAVGHLRDVRR